MRYIVPIVFLLIIIWSCSPEPLEISLPPFESEVVVFSQVIPDEFMTVLLTKTIGALDFNEEEGDSLSQNILTDLLETDAIVSVSYRDITDTLFEVPSISGENGSGVYVSVQTPQYVNEEYTLKITTKTGEQLSAKSLMLPKVPFAEVTPVIQRTIEDTLVTIEYTITDLPEDNWYMLNFYTNGDGSQGGIDINSFFKSGSNDLKRTELLDDDLFDGDTFEGIVELPNVSETDSLVVTLSNINEQYFKFLEAREASGTLFTELTKEPISSPTNVEGWIGFFNTHFPDIQFYDLNEF